MGRQEILIGWPRAWLADTTVLQGSYSHSSVKEKIPKGVGHGKIIPKMVKERDFIILLLFFPLVTKYLVELVIWQHMLGLKTFLSFAKLPKNSLSSGEGHLNMSHVDSRHDMFCECNCLLTWRFQLQWDKECGIWLLAKLWACPCFVCVTISSFMMWHQGSGWWNLIPGKSTMGLYNTKKVDCFPLCELSPLRREVLRMRSAGGISSSATFHAVLGTVCAVLLFFF